MLHKFTFKLLNQQNPVIILPKSPAPNGFFFPLSLQTFLLWDLKILQVFFFFSSYRDHTPTQNHSRLPVWLLPLANTDLVLRLLSLQGVVMVGCFTVRAVVLTVVIGGPGVCHDQQLLDVTLEEEKCVSDSRKVQSCFITFHNLACIHSATNSDVSKIIYDAVSVYGIKCSHFLVLAGLFFFFYI